MLEIMSSAIQEQINTAARETGGQADAKSAVGVALNTVFGIVGVVAVVMVVIGGVSYTTSQGDPGKLKKARDTILYGIIGMVISLSAFAITGFILNGLSG